MWDRKKWKGLLVMIIAKNKFMILPWSAYRLAIRWPSVWPEFEWSFIPHRGVFIMTRVSWSRIPVFIFFVVCIFVFHPVFCKLLLPTGHQDIGVGVRERRKRGKKLWKGKRREERKMRRKLTRLLMKYSSKWTFQQFLPFFLKIFTRLMGEPKVCDASWTRVQVKVDRLR